MNKKTKIVSAIVALIIAIFGGSQLIGSAPIITTGTLMGSADNYISWPNSYVKDRATTTSSNLVEDAGTITQDINVKNFNSIRFNTGLVGGSATSTPFMRFQTSPDNINFFDITGITGNASTTVAVGTTTPAMLPSVLTLADPGLASTTDSFIFDVSSISYLRVLFMGENTSGTSEGDDGVQGWVNYQLFGEY